MSMALETEAWGLQRQERTSVVRPRSRGGFRPASLWCPFAGTQQAAPAAPRFMHINPSVMVCDCSICLQRLFKHTSGKEANNKPGPGQACWWGS